MPTDMLEIHFREAEAPYLLMAALRRHTEDALTAAFLVPSDDGPALALQRRLVEDPEVGRLLTYLEGTIVNPS